MTKSEREMMLRMEVERTWQQKQSDAEEKQKREATKEERARKEKEQVEKALKERGLPQAPRAKKGAESKEAEPTAGGSAEKKKGTKPKASTSGSSVASTGQGAGAATSEPVTWKSSAETMNYLNQLHEQLYPSPKAREQKDQIQRLFKGFHAREKIRKNSYLMNQVLTNQQVGYSRKKRRLHEQRLAEDHSKLSDLDKLGIAAEDEDAYDSEADREAERLEQSLLREKASQVQWKKEHRKATEERDH